MDALAIERLVVGAGRIGCDVALAAQAPRTTSPQIAARVCASFSACCSSREWKGTLPSLVTPSTMEATSLPHLLEHLVIDLQTQAAPPDASPDTAYVGITRWTDENAGRAHIEVRFTDDLVALRAFRDAARFLNEAVVL